MLAWLEEDTPGRETDWVWTRLGTPSAGCAGCGGARPEGPEQGPLEESSLRGVRWTVSRALLRPRRSHMSAHGSFTGTGDRQRGQADQGLGAPVKTWPLTTDRNGARGVQGGSLVSHSSARGLRGVRSQGADGQVGRSPAPDAEGARGRRRDKAERPIDGSLPARPSRLPPVLSRPPSVTLFVPRPLPGGLRTPTRSAPSESPRGGTV